MKNKPKVSACIITYNQEKFIHECIKGAVKQKLDYPYEIVIGEDCSSDTTKTICKAYADKYPNLIRLIDRNKNLGMNGNWIESIKACDGKYIALCEGDDYWTDPYKLQKQADFLEENEDYSACYHRCLVINEKGGVIKADKWSEYNDRTSKDMMLGNAHLITNTVMFRNKISFPAEAKRLKNLDTTLWHLLGFYGSAKFLKIIKPSAYRIHEGGVWSLKQKFYQLRRVLETYSFFVKNLKEKAPYLKLYPLYKNIAKMLDNYMVAELAKGDLMNYFRGIWVFLSSNLISKFQFLKLHKASIFKIVKKQFK
jgi:glycosyltransferase involved in cell wall biosynthesis